MSIPAFKRPARESRDVQGPVVKYARSNGLVAIKTSSEGNRSFMDYTFFAAGGITFFIEFKAREKTPTPSQYAKQKTMKDKGFIVSWVDNVTEGKKIVDLFL